MKGMTSPPVAGEVYLHHKGAAYTIVCLAKDQEEQQLYVIHQGQDGQVWSRTIGNFMAYTEAGAPRFTLLQTGFE